MDSYPYHKNQIPTFPYSYYYPNGQIPARPDMNVDPGKFYGSWPLGGYPCPVSHGGCCHSSNFQQPSSCALRPPYPHIAPHPFHYVPPGPYPFHYAPPPYFSMEQPHYGFPNSFPTDHHCCGCPNHPCKKNETKDLKIEEHDENVDRKNGEAMVPFNAWSHPYPVGWFPYMKNSEGMKDGEDLRLTTPHKQDGKSMPFPYPIVWMPDQPKDTPKIGRKVIDLGPNSSSDQELPPLLEPNPKGSLDDEGKAFNSGIEEKKTVNKGVSFPKVIPVKQLEDHNDMKSPSNQTEGNSAHATMKPKTENGDKKLMKENGPQQVSSSKKPSKLPPVCLRVDPFPRKNGQNKPHDRPKDKHTVPLNGIGTSECEGLCGVSNKVEESKCNTKTVKVNIQEATQGEDAQKKANAGCAFPTGESESPIGSVGVKGVAPCDQENGTCPGKVVLCDNTKGQTKTLTKIEFSESEAATKIQSAYRGFEVRKWETLKKLKQISSFKEQVAELRTHIQALEDSSDKPVDDKQKNVIAETIMNLLLKLDAIQGLHPSVREVRKSVTRELVILQEKLDSLVGRSLPQQTTTKHHLTAENAIGVDGSATCVDGNATVIQGHPNNTMEQCEEGELLPLPLENSHDMVPDDGQENDDQIDDAQPTSMESLEAKEMTLDLDQCPSSTNYDVEKTDASHLDVPSQEEQQKGLDESCLLKDQVKENAQAPPLDSILNGVEHEEEVEARTDQETGICRQTSEATKGDSDGLPQDDAGLVEAEHLDRKLEDDDKKKQQVQDENVELKSGGETAPKEAEEAVVNETAATAEVAGLSACSDQEGDSKHVMEDNEELDREMEGDDQKKQQVQGKNVELKSGTETTAREEAVVNETAAAAEVAGWSEPSDQEGDSKHVAEDNGKLDKEMEDDDQKQQQVQDENVELKSGGEKDVEVGAAEEEAAVSATAVAADSGWSAYSNLEGDRKLVMEENEKLRKLMEGLVESGKEQLTTISALSARINQLEKMLSSSRRKKKLKMRKQKSRALPEMDSSEVV
ncbi:unnamed protein product [Cuscuta epithymum]|uniref:BAG domain-containing protein n=1 Tax=Cuscuta epithymum TaxID=186058 RepID=A0AAV0DY87_9ASTE|nr:unnamed protein product [Cuscuta epithymum]